MCDKPNVCSFRNIFYSTYNVYLAFDVTVDNPFPTSLQEKAALVHL